MGNDLGYCNLACINIAELDCFLACGNSWRSLFSQVIWCMYLCSENHVAFVSLFFFSEGASLKHWFQDTVYCDTYCVVWHVSFIVSFGMYCDTYCIVARVSF